MLGWAWVVIGCSPADPPADGLLPEDRAVRVSMALRGVRPSVDELREVRAHPDRLPSLVDEWLDDPRFGATIRAMAHEAWVLASGVASVPLNGALADESPARIRSSIADSLPRLIERVVERDEPYTNILSADYTMADDVVARAWTGLAPYNPVGPTWQALPHLDGRPAAGVLVDDYWYVAYRSAGANYNRGRANQAVRTLLCEDFLSSDPIPDTSINLADPEVVEDAVDTNPDCAVCHRDLDPLASFFAMRPYPVIVLETWPIQMYDPEYVDLWIETTGEAPSYFGVPGGDLGDLAALVAADPLFASCTVRQHLAYFEQTPLDDVDAERVEALTDGFVEGGYRIKALMREIVLSDAFLAPDRVNVARPEQLSTLFEDLTGFVWSVDSEVECCGAYQASGPFGHVPDLLGDAFVGYKVLAGGVDAPHVRVATHTVHPTYEMVLRTYAQLAAEHVVEADLLGDGPVTLLSSVRASTSREAAIRDQLAELFERLYGEAVEPDGAEVDEAWALWSAARDHHDGDNVAAWRVTLTALLQDIHIATY